MLKKRYLHTSLFNQNTAHNGGKFFNAPWHNDYYAYWIGQPVSYTED